MTERWLLVEIREKFTTFASRIVASLQALWNSLEAVTPDLDTLRRPNAGMLSRYLIVCTVRVSVTHGLYFLSVTVLYAKQ